MARRVVWIRFDLGTERVEGLDSQPSSIISCCITRPCNPTSTLQDKAPDNKCSSGVIGGRAGSRETTT